MVGYRESSPENEGQGTVDGGIVGVVAILDTNVDARVTFAIERAASVHNLQSGNNGTGHLLHTVSVQPEKRTVHLLHTVGVQPGKRTGQL